MIPPLQRFVETEYKNKNQVWGSRRVSHAWSHFQRPVSLTPVLLVMVRCRAIALSSLLRNMVFCGLEGMMVKMKKPRKVVIAPRTRKRSCQLVMVVMSTVPMPYAIKPLMRLEMPLPMNHAACLFIKSLIRDEHTVWVVPRACRTCRRRDQSLGR